jgi:sortase A
MLVLLAVIPAMDAVYLTGKAHLAQWLIARSWHSEQPAAKPWPWADTHPIAKIDVPAVSMRAWVLNGATGHSLSFGPGLADGSVPIGQPGVVLIAGHRDTSFQPLQHVQHGDSILLEDEARQSFAYRITDISIADARYSTINTATHGATLILVTCYPFDALTAGGPLRYVVQAELITDTGTDLRTTSSTADAMLSTTIVRQL